jgi:cytoskeletal protein RodZ
MDIGATLRDAREHRGLSIEALAHTTRINAGVLRAIELNAFERLPAEVFTRGFLRAYAREVGVDAQKIVDQYTAELDRADTAARPVPGDAAVFRASESELATTAPARFSTSHWRMMTVAVLAAAVVYLMSVATPHRPAPPVPVVPPVEAAPIPVAASGSAEAVPAPVATAGAPLQVAIQATAPCWVSATADGTRVMYKTMEPGERQTIAVKDALDLRVGDAGGLALSIDGVPGKSLGASGQPVTVHIARDNYRTLLMQPVAR